MQFSHVGPAPWRGFSYDGEEKGWRFSERVREAAVGTLWRCAAALLTKPTGGRIIATKSSYTVFHTWDGPFPFSSTVLIMGVKEGL